MEYTKVEQSTLILKKPIESKNVTLIWSNDGWCYIPQLKIRQKFTETQYYREDWHGVIAMPEYIEQVNWILYSKEPLTWQENEDFFSQKVSTQKVNKNMRRPQVHRQRPQQL